MTPKRPRLDWAGAVVYFVCGGIVGAGGGLWVWSREYTNASMGSGLLMIGGGAAGLGSIAGLLKLLGYTDDD